MKPQPISTADKSARLLLFDGSWHVGFHTGGQWYDEPDCPIYPTHYLPLPEPPAPKQAYVFLEEGDKCEAGDEYYATDGGWVEIIPDMVGSVIESYHQPHRRKLPTPNPES